jgi:mannose-6-phosphate isomerase
MTVVALPANQPDTFYRGAGRIAAFRSTPALPDRPEDWVASTTSRFGLAPAGLTTLPDGRLLADAVAADPARWLGPGRTDAGILVKLLDAGQRLPLHVHPDRRFAHEHLASPYGKTEAWVVVSAEPDAEVNLGFARDVSADELAGWVRDQDVDAMLAATNRVPVRAGDGLLCPAGVPHAIGAGILVVEVQEPTDFSVLLEYAGFGLDGPVEGHLRLGYDLALACVDRSAWDADRLAGLRGTAGRVLPPAADPFFRVDRVTAPARLAAGFGVVVVTDGAGELSGAHDRLAVRRGDTLVVPYAAGPLDLTGDGTVLHLTPPVADGGILR